MNPYHRDILRPGMVMGYRSSSLFGKVIATKTWLDISHVETYIGGGMSVAARWEGVNMYPVREDKYLCIVLEPTGPFNIDGAKLWFMNHAQGMKYDLWGMRIFYRLIKKANPNRMWCSELCTEFYRAGGFEPFQPMLSSERVSPAQFLQTGALRPVWYSDDAYRSVPMKY
jgi:hypothetical protein